MFQRNSFLVFLGILLFSIALLSLGIGRYALSFLDVIQLIYQKLSGKPILVIQQQIIFQIRLPRVLLAAMVGAGLALSGTVLQGIFRNPLVDPHIIGVTAGAAFGGTMAIFLGFHLWGLFFSSTLFGIFTLITIFLLTYKGHQNLLMLILLGMILNGFFSALVSLLQYIADTEEKLPNIVFWLMGSFATANWEKLLFFTCPFGLCSLVLYTLRWRLNLLSLGDKEAKALGIQVMPLRWLMLCCCGIIVACQVAISGCIGWIGLIIPHFSRILVGANHQRLLPCAMLIGAIYMLIIDDLARTLTHGEIPISILTALLGTPLFTLFVYRLQKEKYG